MSSAAFYERKAFLTNYQQLFFSDLRTTYQFSIYKLKSHLYHIIHSKIYLNITDVWSHFVLFVCSISKTQIIVPSTY